MKELKQSPARDFIIVDGVYYFRYFNTSPMARRYEVFAEGIGYRQIYDYLFVTRKDKKIAIYYLNGDSEVVHGPVCCQYKEPEYQKPVKYVMRGTDWNTWNPFS